MELCLDVQKTYKDGNCSISCTSKRLNVTQVPSVVPVVMYGCKSWTVKKAERRRIDAFELWCWRRLLRVPFLDEISSLSHSVVFLCFFALIAEEGFLISSCYSLELCIQSLISFLFSFAFHFSSFNSYL